MKKNMLFSLALCAGLLLPQGSSASQTWNDYYNWGVQGLKSAAQTAYSYLPSGSSLTNWVNSLSEKDKNDLRVALGMTGAFAVVGTAGYYYTQRQQQLAQEVERLRKDLELDKDSIPTAGTVGKIAFFYKPGRESVQDKALEQIFKEDICRSLETLPISPTVFIADVISQAKKSFPTHAWAVSFDIQLLKSLKTLLEKLECNAGGLIAVLNFKIKNMMEQQRPKLRQKIEEIVPMVEYYQDEDEKKEISDFEQKMKEEMNQPRTGLDQAVKQKAAGRKEFNERLIKGMGIIDNMMQQVINKEEALGADSTGLTLAVIATIIGNYAPADQSEVHYAAFERYFEENVCHVFNNELFNDVQFVIGFVNSIVKKTSSLYPSIPVKNILKSFRILVFKGSCDNTKELLEYLELMISELPSAQ